LTIKCIRTILDFISLKFNRQTWQKLLTKVHGLKLAL
jgi:hypothetical protein